jgi:hypothetical protein
MAIVGWVLIVIGVMLQVIPYLQFQEGNVNFWTSMSAPFSRARDYLYDPGPAMVAVGRTLSASGFVLLWLSLFVGFLS